MLRLTRIPAILVMLVTLVAGGTAAAQADLTGERALTDQNPLFRRYFMRVPQVIHIKLGEKGDAFTCTRHSDGSLRLTPGLTGEAFLTLTPSETDLQLVVAAAKDGRFDLSEKLAVGAAFLNFSEKPFQPPAVAEVPAPDASYLSSYEQQLVKVSSMSKRMRWLFNKVMTASNQLAKLYYGVQIRVLTALSERSQSKVLEQVSSEVADDIACGRVEIGAKSLLEQLAGVVVVHVLGRSEDAGAYQTILKGLLKRLQVQAMTLRAQQPGRGASGSDREQAHKVRLETVQKLIELIQNNG